MLEIINQRLMSLKVLLPFEGCQGLDFVVLESEFGDTVTKDRFTYNIPAHAEVHDPRTPKPKKPIVETREMVITVVDMGNEPIRGATVRFGMLDNSGSEHKTDENGVARSETAPVYGDRVVSVVDVEVTAPGYRRAEWGIGSASGVNGYRLLLAPITKGTTINESGKPLADIWISSEWFRFRTDGLLRHHEYGERDNDWSDDAGHFILDTAMTLRNNKGSVLLAAVDNSISNMAFAFVPASKLNEPQKLVLKAACKIKGVCLFEGVSENSQIVAMVEDAQGRRLASVSPLTRSDGETMRAEFRLRLPEGQYFLKSRGSSSRPPFSVPSLPPFSVSSLPPFSVPLLIKKGQHELDFGTVNVSISP